MSSSRNLSYHEGAKDTKEKLRVLRGYFHSSWRSTQTWPPLWILLLVIAAAGVSACQQADPVATAPVATDIALSPTTALDPVETGYPVAAVSPTPPATAYPAPVETAEAAYPASTSTGGTSPATAAAGAGSATTEIFIPMVEGPSATALPATASPTASPTPFPTVDFAAVQSTLQGQGRELAYTKIGFHVTFLEDKSLLDNWMRRLDQAGVPFFLKTVDNAEPLYIAQEMMRQSGVPHVLVYRASDDLPDYNLPPQEAARQHWQLHRDKFPPELDPSLVWLETINEPDRLRSEWLAEFALETARLALAEGFRWAAFGWAAGEPEPEHWQSPAMLEFLRLAGENPDRLAIALHEGSATAEDAAFDYPYRTGRFLQLFAICDQYGIPRPTVLITEWGWEYDNIPPIDKAMADIEWASRLYAPFPEVKGAAIWNLGTGCCFGTVSEQVRELINPLTRFALTRYFERPASQLAPTDSELYRP